tara:strand:- start:3292 stop:4284 length:993 start_codon:yes stop_codon:yes gene_type:complete
MAFLCQTGSATSTSTINLPDYFEQPMKDIIADAGKLYGQDQQIYGGPRIEGFNADQLGIQDDIKNYTGYTDDINTAIDNLQNIKGDYTADTITGDKFTGANIDSYMNPYISNVADVAKQKIREEAAMADQRLGADIASKGAFGNSRASAMQARGESDLQDRLAQVDADLLYKGYGQAADIFGKDADRGLKADQLSGAFGLEAEKLNNLTDMNVASGIAGLAGSGQNLFTGEMGLKGASADATQMMGQATKDLAYQDFLDQQATPYNQLNYYTGILQGLSPTAPTTTTTTNPAPSPFQQMAGLGINALGMYGMGGGFSPTGFSMNNMFPQY